MRRKKKQNNKMDDSWLLPYADLLTLLLALFIVLYASSEINEQKFFDLRDAFQEHLAASGSAGIIDGGEGIQDPSSGPDAIDQQESEEEEIEEEPEEEVDPDDLEQQFSAIQYEEFLALQGKINSYISEYDMEDRISTQLTDEGLLLTIVNDVLFDSGQAELKEESRETATEISELLYTEPPHQIVISGHADDVPISDSIYASNWELSVARAVNFMILVLENSDLDPTLFSAKGFGEYRPLFPNDSPENRARNRRVEVLILPNLDLNQEQVLN